MRTESEGVLLHLLDQLSGYGLELVAHRLKNRALSFIAMGGITASRFLKSQGLQQALAFGALVHTIRLTLSEIAGTATISTSSAEAIPPSRLTLSEIAGTATSASRIVRIVACLRLTLSEIAGTATTGAPSSWHHRIRLTLSEIAGTATQDARRRRCTTPRLTLSEIAGTATICPPWHTGSTGSASRFLKSQGLQPTTS